MGRRRERERVESAYRTFPRVIIFVSNNRGLWDIVCVWHLAANRIRFTVAQIRQVDEYFQVDFAGVYKHTGVGLTLGGNNWLGVILVSDHNYVLTFNANSFNLKWADSQLSYCYRT